MWYRDGTVTVTNGSAIVTGIGTLFLQAAPVSGDLFTLDGSVFYEVKQANSQTELELEFPYTGATLSGQSYALIRAFSSTLTAELAQQMYELLLKWESRENEYLAWLGGTADGGPFNNGTYPITDYAGVIHYVLSPAALEENLLGNFIFMGAWDDNLNYEQNNIVSHNGGIWISLVLNGVEPGTDETKWKVLIPFDGIDGIPETFNWHFVAGVPAPALGVNGNLAMNTLNYDIYRKEGGVWVKRGNTGAGGGNQEVFYESPDPAIAYPAINFIEGYFPARPTIPAMKVFKP